MRIANPIYDVVFKYLMEDSKIARLIISSLIQEDIETIEFMPKEVISYEEYKSRFGQPQLFFTVYRLDFKAKIKTETGQKIVLIEIQKAKFATDIMRFRRYLGENYLDSENSYIEFVNGREVKKAYPIISIYFLGHKLNRIDNPVIKVQPKYIDLITGEKIDGKEDFIESLTHSSIVIQIPQLKEKRKSDLEILLSVFDQSNITADTHILNVREEDFPEKYRDIIRRLQTAVVEPQMRDKMIIEDEIFKELETKEREIERREDIIIEKEKTIGEKDRAIEEKDKAIEELRREINELRKMMGN
ncbi:MAG: hypothetical protein QG635_2475 [Bacteroidota bacterium]|nr:hypothetical protein [Bacteroidota bacterium]